jgi:hypothetical protein
MRTDARTPKAPLLSQYSLDLAIRQVDQLRLVEEPRIPCRASGAAYAYKHRTAHKYGNPGDLERLRQAAIDQ